MKPLTPPKPLTPTRGDGVPAMPGAGACTVIVMAKAPVAGFAKTRLIPVLGAAGAAALAGRLLARAVAEALAAELGPVELCVTPDADHPAFDALRAAGRVRLSDQGAGDLGVRMNRALGRVLAAGSRTLLIGTDAPALTAGRLRAAAEALSDHDAVFVPALDGGYALVGLAGPVPGLFDRIDWSTARVMAQTRARLAAAAVRFAELPPVADIDEPADLAHPDTAGWLAPDEPASSG